MSGMRHAVAVSNTVMSPNDQDTISTNNIYSGSEIEAQTDVTLYKPYFYDCMQKILSAILIVCLSSMVEQCVSSRIGASTIYGEELICFASVKDGLPYVVISKEA